MDSSFESILTPGTDSFRNEPNSSSNDNYSSIPAILCNNETTDETVAASNEIQYCEYKIRYDTSKFNYIYNITIVYYTHAGLSRNEIDLKYINRELITRATKYERAFGNSFTKSLTKATTN